MSAERAFPFTFDDDEPASGVQRVSARLDGGEGGDRLASALLQACGDDAPGERSLTLPPLRLRRVHLPAA